MRAMGQHSAPLMAFTDGILGGPPGGPMPGKLMAFQDGSLGQYDQAAAGVQGFGQFDGPLMAYSDGILGGPPGGQMPGDNAAYKDGVLGKLRGIGEYFSSGVSGMGEYIRAVGQDEPPAPMPEVAPAPASSTDSKTVLFGLGALALAGYLVMRQSKKRPLTPNRRRRRRR